MNDYQTKQRKELLCFFEKHCDEQLPISAILSELGEKNIVSRSAVYRNIERMIAEGIIRKSAKAEGIGSLYHYIGSPHCNEHLHLQCNHCGKIFHLENETEEDRLKKVLRNIGFSLDEQKTMLYGICRDCN